MSISRWSLYEQSFRGPTAGNPFVDVDFRAEFVLGNRVVPVRGFYDGEGRYTIRFMPDTAGNWQFRTISNVAELSGKTGAFEVGAAENGSHGPIRVVNRFGFAYADGVEFVPVGTTAYAWAHQSQSLIADTLETLSNSPFTKIRMCLFPKDYSYNENEPESFVFPGSLEEGFDFRRFNPEFFRTFESLIARLSTLGIEADLILFHPYDRWGFKSMPADVDDAYLRYTVARLAAFPNVWWSMANEWDLMNDKTEQDFDRYFRIVQSEDPYDHLRSVHNCRVFYDHLKPWVSHCSVQSSSVEKTRMWREQYGKPVVIDECCYEGNIPQGWGNISAEELCRRQWAAVSGGGWPAAHGETYYNDEEILWWSKGGVLTGESVPRIAFMRRILAEAPASRLSPVLGRPPSQGVHDGERYFLYYFGLSRPLWTTLVLPDDRTYRIDVIDTWNMTVETIGSGFRGKTRVNLPGREYIAVRCVAGS